MVGATRHRSKGAECLAECDWSLPSANNGPVLQRLASRIKRKARGKTTDNETKCERYSQ
jgi:hypothetical protein